MSSNHTTIKENRKQIIYNEDRINQLYNIIDRMQKINDMKA